MSIKFIEPQWKWTLPVHSTHSQYPVPVPVYYLVSMPESGRDKWMRNHFEENHIANYKWYPFPSVFLPIVNWERNPLKLVKKPSGGF